jgi:hypothetical protein
VADEWTDCTVLGGVFEEQVSDSGEHRHRRASIGPVRYYDDWTPGPAPVMGARRPEPTPAEIAEMLRINPMRMLSRLRCADCGYEWQQPKPHGLCPQCHSSATALYEQTPCVLRKA